MRLNLDRLWINYPSILPFLSPWKLTPILESHSMPNLWHNHLHFPINWPLIIAIKRLEFEDCREILLVWDLSSCRVLLCCWIGVLLVWHGLDWSWMSDTRSNRFGCNSSFYINKVVCSFSHILVHIYDAYMFKCCWFHLFIIYRSYALIVVVFCFYWQVLIEWIQFEREWQEQFKGDQRKRKITSKFLHHIYLL